MLDTVKTLLTSDIVVRAFKTFVQAALAVVLVSDQPFSKAAVVAAVAAGISAVYNFVRQTI